MIYKRQDVLGEKETFEGSSIEILQLIKLLENIDDIYLGVDEGNLYISIPDDLLIDIDEAGEDFE